MTTKPQDRRQPKAEIDAQKQANFSEIEGSELLRPFSQLKASDAMRITGKLLGAMGEEILDSNGDIDINDLRSAVSALNWEQAADFIDFIDERYVIDKKGWEAFNHANNMNAVMDLVFSYASELGKDES